MDGNGWNDIDYHSLVGRLVGCDGAAAAGRPDQTPSARVICHNAGKIGICLLGGHGWVGTAAFSDY